MPIDVCCPRCGKPMQAPDSAAGKRGRCKDCGAVFQISRPVQGESSFRPRVQPERHDEPGMTTVVINQRSGCGPAFGGCLAAAGIAVFAIVIFAALVVNSAREVARHGRERARQAAPVVPAPPNPIPAPKAEPEADASPQESGRILKVPKGIDALPEPPTIVAAPTPPAPPPAEPDGPRPGDTVVLCRPGDLAHVYLATDQAALEALNEYLARGVEGPFRRLVDRKAILRVPNGVRATVSKVRPKGLYVSFKEKKKVVAGWVPTDHAIVQGR